QRLSLYKKLASCDSDEALLALQEELIDRYGRLPEPARALVETHRLRLMAEKLGIRKIDAAAESITLTFVPNPPLDPARLVALLQRDRTRRMLGPQRLRIEAKTNNLEARVQALRQILRELA
ncbi:MAG: transcription-repair coupling factor, partial [Burkholderiaceae bacterium]|nr:transcription-repair coupling factor [Burkholderiaceae bacterium]